MNLPREQDKMKKGVLFLLYWLCYVSPSFGQVENETRPVTFYRYLEEGFAPIQVNVWGDVNAAGRYEVKTGTGLMELLFLAGGPGERILNAKEFRKAIVRLSRKSEAGWSVVLEISLEDLMTSNQPDLGLQDEDVLKIETEVRQKFGWRDVVSMIGTAGTLALVADRILR